jgi:hypothetical protein
LRRSLLLQPVEGASLRDMQVRLQPEGPKDRTAVPGRKWLRGFFSIGSRQKPDWLVAERIFERACRYE